MVLVGAAIAVLFMAVLYRTVAPAAAESWAPLAVLAPGGLGILLILAYIVVLVVIGYFVVLGSSRAFEAHEIARERWAQERRADLRMIEVLRGPLDTTERRDVDAMLDDAYAGKDDGTRELYLGRVLHAIAYVALPLAVLPFVLPFALFVLAMTFSIGAGEFELVDVPIVLEATFELTEGALAGAQEGKVILTLPSLLPVVVAIASPLSTLILHEMIALADSLIPSLSDWAKLLALVPIVVTVLLFAGIVVLARFTTACGEALREAWNRRFDAAWDLVND